MKAKVIRFNNEVVIYKGNDYIVVCNGKDHCKVLEDGCRVPLGTTCADWVGGCPNNPSTDEAVIKEAKEAIAKGVQQNYKELSIGELIGSSAKKGDEWERAEEPGECGMCERCKVWTSLNAVPLKVGETLLLCRYCVKAAQYSDAVVCKIEEKKVAMRKVRVHDGLIYSIIHYYLNDDPDGAYYRVRQDSDTESIMFIDPKDPGKNESLLQPLSGYPDGCKTIMDVIHKHMAERGFHMNDIIEEQ